MIQKIETEVLAVLRDMLSSDSRLAPTKKLARMLAGSGRASIETPLSSIGMPPDLSFDCSREISGAQVTPKGDSCYATPALP